MPMEMTIGLLAKRAGVAASTIRYYEEVNLLPRPARASGRRIFDEASLNRLLVITFAKEAGFSLREIRQLFDGFASDTAAGVRWQKLATAKLAEMEALAERIETMKELLREALRCGCVELDACGKLFRQRADRRPPR
jgi:MerR family transcriptional regulator, redox-sensitive transcriptional activator SoxR